MGHQVNKTTQAGWFVTGLNRHICQESNCPMSLCMQIDSVEKAASNVEANLGMGGSSQMEEKGNAIDGGDYTDYPYNQGKGGFSGKGSGQLKRSHIHSQSQQNSNMREPGRLPEAQDTCNKCGGRGHWQEAVPVTIR